MGETITKKEDLHEASSSEFLTKGMTGLFWKYALLALVGTIFSNIAVILDGYFMGNGVGQMALAGIAVVISLMYLCMATFNMIGVGASTLAGIKIGAGDEEGAKEVYGSTLVFTTLITVIFSILALIFCNPILRFLGATDTVLPYARDYALIFFVFFPLCILGQVAYFFCRVAGRPRPAAIVFTLAGVAAMIVEYVLVFHCHWGTSASAVDFVIGIAGTAPLLLYLQKQKTVFALGKKHLRIHKQYTWETLKIGFPMFLFNFCPLITTVIINRQLITYGGSDLHLAAFGIFNAYIVYVLNGITNAFAAGMQPIASVNLGAKKYGRLRSVIKVGVVQSFVVLLVLQIIVYVFARPFVGFFAGGSAELVGITVEAMRFFIIVYAFGNVATLVGGYYISVEKNLLALVNSTTRVLIFAVPMLFVIPRFLGLNGVWLAQPFADVLACVVAVICIAHELKTLRNKEIALINKG